ncbi:hydroxysqualene dehydroxylase HpnE [Pseudoroseomonas ludipueritiae]|uniref:FAD-dependent oxidoreductase n=1 Tax=Pseudoroseomonas ludipueritiae TaxID=198093 RepID=A0ABR7RAS2_9PROT|nr:hydroxysqualene dehydroxylase HpnE [Pseudoroseomonas ludipueritiae]MBC9178927.1 FAD-dependent oxidoreductase [Pseudoroseomonas ludipueritiae]
MTVHVAGAGLAGLAAAVALAGQGARVVLWEAAKQAGGRCRSYHDAQLGMVIDNGNHLVLSGNPAVGRYLRAIGAEHRLAGPEQATYPFLDRRDGSRWALRPNDGPLPWWVFSGSRRVPGTGPGDYLALAALLRRHPGRRIGDVMACQGPLWDRLLRPLLVSILNTRPEDGDADLAGAVLRESLAKGGLASRPRIATPTLDAAFVAPALDYLRAAGAEIRLGQRLRGLRLEGERLGALAMAEGTVPLGPADSLVLAVPPWVAQELLPGLQAPDDFRPILNAHFAATPPPGAPAMVGLVGGTADWVFAYPDRLSTTTSDAGALMERDTEALAAALWQDVAATHGLSGPVPPCRLVKERRATFAATPAQAARRPKARTAWQNLFLAGDWTDTGLPATIEGALRSGEAAAALAFAGPGASEAAAA